MFISCKIDLQDTSSVRAFVALPFTLYRGNKNWVAPIKKNLYNMLVNGSGMQLGGGPYALFAVKNGRKIVGRILAGVNRVKNSQRKANEGYFSLFECIDDMAAAQSLINAAKDWFREQNVDFFTGPVSPTNGDDHRGILLEGFDRMPTVNTAYTMAYYQAMMDALGMEKYLDFYAFDINFSKAQFDRVRKIVAFGKKKTNIEIDHIHLDDIKNEARDIHRILMLSMRSQWAHLEIPTYDQVLDEFSSMKKLLNEKLIYIARKEGEPVGMIASVPDYNQVLCHMNGKLGLVSALKYLYYKKRITRVKNFMQFIVPRFQGTFVLPSLYAAFYEEFIACGYQTMECATVAEINAGSLNTLKGVGFEKCMTYRIYKGTL